jgi:hypothetical protein
VSAPFVHDSGVDSNHWRETTPSFALRPDQPWAVLSHSSLVTPLSILL